MCGVGYRATAMEMPTAVGIGATREAAIADLNETLVATIAMLLASGGTPPQALGERKLEQVNIRISAEEKLLLRELARKFGDGRNTSDLIRSAIREKLGLPV